MIRWRASLDAASRSCLTALALPETRLAYRLRSRVVKEEAFCLIYSDRQEVESYEATISEVEHACRGCFGDTSRRVAGRGPGDHPLFPGGKGSRADFLRAKQSRLANDHTFSQENPGGQRPLRRARGGRTGRGDGSDPRRL